MSENRFWFLTKSSLRMRPSAASAAVILLVLPLLHRCPETAAANVLAIEPLPARSHWTFMRAVLRAMAADGGHNVTAYTPFASTDAPRRLSDRVCGGGPAGCGYAEVPLRLDGVPDKVSLDLAQAVADFADQWRFMEVAVDKSRKACELIDRMAAAGRFAAASVRYDLVVVELVSSECASRVSGALGGVPLAYVFPSPMASWVEAKALGTSPGPSYAARLFARRAAPDTFAARVDNAYGWTVTAALQWYHELDADDTGYRKPAVTFVNSDWIVERPVPGPPNMVRVGGVHLPQPEPVPSWGRWIFTITSSTAIKQWLTVGSVYAMTAPQLQPQTQRVVVALFVAAACLLPPPQHPVDGARVLAFSGVAGKSHWNFMRGVLRAMVDGGHRVTVYTQFPGRGAAAVINYTELDTFAEYSVHMVPLDVNATEAVPLFANPSLLFPFMVNGSRLSCDIADRLLADRRGDEFDAFVTEPLSSECVSHAARRLGVPLIYTVPSPVPSWIEASVFGHPANPAYVPHLFSAHSAVAGTFFRRLSNAATYLSTAYVHYRATRAAAALDGRYYDRVPPVKPALVFVNTHYVTEPANPAPANRIDVGGIHLAGPEPLPAEILEFIEDSPNGVILLTLGSVVALSTLNDEIQKAFKDAIAEVPQRVLIKYEREMHDKPKNVMTSKWLPQRDILLHPSVKLFISHGGISGVYEAVDAGVPVLGFPLFYDQPRNVANLVSAGMAISLDLFSVTKDDLLKSINELVNNETYAQNAKKVSRIFKDRPISPAQSVVYWTDYVIRHNGASHLKSQALNLSWYQYFLLDVIALVLFVFVLAFYTAYRVLKSVKLCVSKLSTKLLKSKSE